MATLFLLINLKSLLFETLLDPEPSPLYKPFVWLLLFIPLTQSLCAQAPLAADDAAISNVGIDYYLLIIGLVSFILSILFYCIQTALGASGRMVLSGKSSEHQSAPDHSKHWASRLLERRCWAMGSLFHVLSIISSVDFSVSLMSIEDPTLILIVSIPIVLCHFIFFDVLIRQVGIKHSEKIIQWFASSAHYLSLPFYPLFRIIYPITGEPSQSERALYKYLREREFQLLPHAMRVDQIVEEEAVDMLDSVREFMESDARDIMTPRTEIEGIEISSTKEQIHKTLIKTPYSRVVVYQENLDHIQGFLLAKEVLLHSDREPLEFLRKPVMADSSMRLSELLLNLKRKRAYLAVILDEYGGTSGIITLQDLFKTVIGNKLEDEKDEQEVWIELNSDGSFLLSGRVEIWEANQEMETDFDGSIARTLGGFLMHEFSRLPEEGEKINVEQGSFEILNVENNRIEFVRYIPNLPIADNANSEQVAADS